MRSLSQRRDKHTTYLKGHNVTKSPSIQTAVRVYHSTSSDIVRKYMRMRRIGEYLINEELYIALAKRASHNSAWGTI